MKIQPYLFFDGRCEEALAFYAEAIGAETTFLMRFKESPDPAHIPPGAEDKVMHAAFKIGETLLMASDGRNSGNPQFAGVALSLDAASVAEADRFFAALGDGGQVQMPMGETFFAERFGMLADKFGVSWMIIAGGKG